MQENALFMMINPNLERINSGLCFEKRQQLEEFNQTIDSITQKPSESPNQFQNSKQKRSKEAGHRAGDWICNICSNHNYSFREICNSCKTQTRINNLREALEMWSKLAPVCNPPEKKTVVRKKLQLRNPFHLEVQAKSDIENQQPNIQLSKVNYETCAPQKVEFKPFSNITKVLDETLNEFPFEKEMFFNHGTWLHSDSDTGEEGVNEANSFEIDRETLKMLNFD